MNKSDLINTLASQFDIINPAKKIEWPLVNDCPVKLGKKHYYLRYQVIRFAKRRAIEQTTEFKDRYRSGVGIEGTISELDRQTGVKRLHVWGFKTVWFSATL